MKELFVVTGKGELLFDTLVVQRDELQGRLVERLHEVQVGAHLHGLELLAGLAVHFDVVVVGCDLQFFFLLLLRELPSLRSHQLAILV